MKKGFIILIVCVAVLFSVSMVFANTLYKENVSAEEVASMQEERLNDIVELQDYEVDYYLNMKNNYHHIDILPEDTEDTVAAKNEYNELVELLHSQIDNFLNEQNNGLTVKEFYEHGEIMGSTIKKLVASEYSGFDRTAMGLLKIAIERVDGCIAAYKEVKGRKFDSAAVDGALEFKSKMLELQDDIENGVRSDDEVYPEADELAKEFYRYSSKVLGIPAT